MYEAQVVNPQSQIYIAVDGRDVVSERTCSSGDDDTLPVDELNINVDLVCTTNETHSLIDDTTLVRAVTGSSLIWLIDMRGEFIDNLQHGLRYAAKISDRRSQGGTDDVSTYTEGNKLHDFYLDEFVVDTFKLEDTAARMAYQIEGDGTGLIMAWYEDSSKFPVQSNIIYKADLYKNNSDTDRAQSISEVTNRGPIVEAD